MPSAQSSHSRRRFSTPTSLRTATLFWAAGAAHVAAAALGAALAAADATEDEEEDGSYDDEQHRQPVWWSRNTLRHQAFVLELML